MGVSRDVVSRAENDRSKPRRIVINAWALATGVPVSWLRDGTGDWEPPGDDDPVRPKGFEPLTFCIGVPDNVKSLFSRRITDEATDSVDRLNVAG